MVYFILFIIISIISLLELTNIKDKYTFILTIFIFLSLLIFAGLRYKTGTDYMNYYQIFKNINLNLYREKGFVLLNYIIKNIFSNFSILILILTLISLSTKFIYIIKFSYYWLITIFLYFSTYFLRWEMGAIRIGIAAGILMHSSLHIKNRNFFKFIFLVFIAFMFHKASILFIIVYFIGNKNYKNRLWLFIILLSIVIGYTNFIEKTTIYILNNFNKDIFIFNKLESYFYRSHSNVSIISTSFIKKITIITLSLFLRNILKTKNKFYNIYMNIVFVGYSLYFLLINSIPELGLRVPTLFVFYEILLIPNFILAFKKTSSKFLIYLLIFFISAGSFTMHLLKWKDLFIPYKNIFIF